MSYTVTNQVWLLLGGANAGGCVGDDLVGGCRLLGDCHCAGDRVNGDADDWLTNLNRVTLFIKEFGYRAGERAGEFD